MRGGGRGGGGGAVFVNISLTVPVLGMCNGRELFFVSSDSYQYQGFLSIKMCCCTDCDIAYLHGWCEECTEWQNITHLLYGSAKSPVCEILETVHL